MKKLALLLAAMGVVSVAAFAGNLQVTDVNQELEYEHTQHGDEDDVTLTTTVGLKYDDWSFGIQGGKMWTNNKKSAEDRRLKNSNGRLQLDVWKSITPEFDLGYRFRGESNQDRHYVRYAYHQDWFLSSADVWYQSNSGESNNQVRMELFPLGATYNGITAKWFVAYDKTLKPAYGEEKDSWEQQIRLYAPIYSDDVFSLSAEGRFTLAADKKMKNNEDGSKAGYRVYKPGRTRLYLKGDYKVTEAFSVYGYVGYEFRSFKYKNGLEKPNKEDKNYQDIGLGWTYKF